ncbi:MAG: hypothetical protein M3R00_03385, partial [Pseudomonadota bacterium]|nr:hypothetical protein [Pseudomonadota bacterium]
MKKQRSSSTDLLLGSSLLQLDSVTGDSFGERENVDLNSPKGKSVSKAMSKRAKSAAAQSPKSRAEIFPELMELDSPAAMVVDHVQLIKQLSEFEQWRIYARRIYRMQLEKPIPYLIKDLNENLFDSITALAYANPLTSLPSIQKIQKAQHEILSYFGSIQVGTVFPHLQTQQSRQSHRLKARTFKGFVQQFAIETWQLMLDILPKTFLYKPRSLSIMSSDITANYFSTMQSLTLVEQLKFSMDPKNIEAVLLSASETDEGFDFVYSAEMRCYWQSLIERLPTEIKDFLLMQYTEFDIGSIDSIHPFEIAYALYEFQCDLARIYSDMITILQSDLTENVAQNWADALATIKCPYAGIAGKEALVLDNLAFCEGLLDKAAFLAIPELDFALPPKAHFLDTRQKPPGGSYSAYIGKKSFPALLSNFFRSYLRTIKSNMEFANLYRLSSAQLFVVKNLPDVSPFGDSPLCDAYRSGVVAFRDAKQKSGEIYRQFNDAIAKFFSQRHAVADVPCIKAVGKLIDKTMLKIVDHAFVEKNPGWLVQKFDQDWLVHTLKNLSVSDVDDKTTHDKILVILVQLYNDLHKVWEQCASFQTACGNLQAKIKKIPDSHTMPEQLIRMGLNLVSDQFTDLMSTSKQLEDKIFVQNQNGQIKTHSLMHLVGEAHKLVT